MTLAASGSIIDLVPVDGAYVGRCVAGRGDRIFGGSTLAHATMAAVLDQGRNRPVDSLHAIFVSAGDARLPVRYKTTMVKRGRSIDVISVAAEQEGRTILVAHVTFHADAPSPEFQDAAPVVTPADETSPSLGWLAASGETVRAPFDVRPLPYDDVASQAITWIRYKGGRQSQGATTALLAYAVDFVITRPAHLLLDPRVVSLSGASLDHAMWFHRPCDIGNWLLVSTTASTFAGSRSLCTTQVFDTAGRLVATATQEALLPPP